MTCFVSASYSAHVILAIGLMCWEPAAVFVGDSVQS